MLYMFLFILMKGDLRHKKTQRKMMLSNQPAKLNAQRKPIIHTLVKTKFL